MFKKGVSGNPKGRGGAREQADRILRKQLDPHLTGSTKAIEAALNQNEDLAIKLAAAKLVYAYLFGTPKQQVEVSGENGGPLVAIIKDA